ncbi:MAG: efflux RND transporter periplasmic adaptor subunit [Alphaproteobacteria bacterium]|nr:efflux RND transporter periplasmic adaptor subunit [Alphaproteobacteria bacterium]
MLRTLVVLTAAVALTACGAGKDNKVKEDDRPVVSVVKAEAAAGASALRASGLVAYQREPVLSFKVGGVIDRIAVDEGDYVRAGQRLAWLRPTEVAAGAKEASAALEVAQRNLDRTQTLFDKGLVAQARLDDAKLAVERARAGSDAAGFNRDTAVIVAPADGLILRRLAEPAQVTGAGAPILTLGEVQSGLIVKAAFPSSAAARIKAGAPATVTVTDSGGAAFKGRVTRIAGKGDGSTGAFDVEIMISAPKGLRSGMVAETTIDVAVPGAVTPGAAASVRIPAMALLDARADQGSVYVVDAQGVARRRIVQTAGLQGETVTVIGGLAPGETIVASGAAYVRDGAAVAIAR